MAAMDAGTIADIVIAATAVAALGLSWYNLRLQKRNAEHQEERWQREEERWRREKLPNLNVEADDRLGWGLPVHIHSLRKVNSGGVPVEIRSLRMVLPDGRKLPLPEADDEVKEHKWEIEQPVGEGLPYVLPPGRSVRFATGAKDMEAKLIQAGFTERVNYQVEVEDALGNIYSVEEWAYLGSPHPEP
jgi:hypothetical protein